MPNGAYYTGGMWPFDMRGPEFLVLYMVISAIVITALTLLRHAGEPMDAPKVNLADPYVIAFLRGGKNESLRVVTMALMDRGLLTTGATKTTIQATEAACAKTRSELEQKVLRHFTPSAEASTLFKTKEADAHMLQYEDGLTGLGLLPDEQQKEARLMRMGVALLIVVGIAIIKLYVALTTGHTNVIYLILLAVLFTVVIVKVARPRQTSAGKRMIDDLKTLFGGLKQKSSQLQNGASPAEFALMAAVFGMSTVPYAKTLFPQGGSSSCGSSCGSSGDGGGDGGGGCGGCGGG
jgi:uncharacterized protein (TIGR04222 family)